MITLNKIKILVYLILCFCHEIVFSLHSVERIQKPIVTAHLLGQMGNNLFQVAAACAVAWDNDAEPYFPELGHVPSLMHHMFSRCNILPPKNNIEFEWAEPEFAYSPIPYHPNMKIYGYLQSEKYFVHHRDKILKLFAPCPRDLKYIKKKFGWLIDHPHTVGVQIRLYTEQHFTQYDKKYLEKAMALFPKSSLFVVSSNDLDFARKNIPAWAENVYFLEGEPAYIDFHLLTFCKHNIITNSSFGWWSAWLNQNPDKVVVRPREWFAGCLCQDVCPDNWISIEAPFMIKHTKNE